MIYKKLTTPTILQPGEALVVVGTKSGTSTPGTPVLEYSLLDEEDTQPANAVVSA